MFKATVLASQLREKMAHYFDMVRGNEVIQVLHRGGPIKVLMTQEHYLDLVSRLTLYEKNSSEKVVTAKTAQEIEATVMEKLKALGQEKELGESDSGKLQRVRAR
jgi:PHD/YefM family antitoxin component YafN of YafNO toxin-antitoxin module